MTEARPTPHKRDAPKDEHVWVDAYRDGSRVRVYCGVCKVTPQEWLDLQPVKDFSILQEWSDHA